MRLSGSDESQAFSSGRSFLVVELLRQGRSPEDACREAVERILRRNPKTKDLGARETRTDVETVRALVAALAL